MNEDYQPTVCVDLDGVLAEYHGWHGEWTEIGEPITGRGSVTRNSTNVDQLIRYEPISAREFCEELQRRGYRVIIHTCRGQVEEVERWLEAWDIPHDGVNGREHNAEGSSGKPFADYYIDDRALRFEGSFRAILAQLGRPTWWDDATSYVPQGQEADLWLSREQLMWIVAQQFTGAEIWEAQQEKTHMLGSRNVELSTRMAIIGYAIEELELAVEDGDLAVIAEMAQIVVDRYNTTRDDPDGH